LEEVNHKAGKADSNWNATQQMKSGEQRVTYDGFRQLS
jgi:hypothetical protein